jgi:hypothetical protein
LLDLGVEDGAQLVVIVEGPGGGRLRYQQEALPVE